MKELFKIVDSFDLIGLFFYIINLSWKVFQKICLGLYRIYKEMERKKEGLGKVTFLILLILPSIFGFILLILEKIHLHKNIFETFLHLLFYLAILILSIYWIKKHYSSNH